MNNNQNLAAEGVVERGRFVCFRIYHFIPVIFIPTFRIVSFSILVVCCFAMRAKVHWMKVHRIKFRVHQKTERMELTRIMSTRPIASDP